MKMQKQRIIEFPVIFSGETAKAQKALFVWNESVKEYLAKCSGEGTAVELHEDMTIAAEGFRLAVEQESIRLYFSDENGARNGVVCLFNSLRYKNGRYSVCCGVTESAPKSKLRGVLLDMARKYLDIEEVKQNLRQMARAQMNCVVFHLLDSAHYALESKAAPSLNGKSKMRQYTRAQMKMLVKYASDLGVEVIPSVDFPAHSCYFLECYPQYACKVNDKGFEKSEWAVCAGNTELFSLIDDMIGEIAKIFPGRYIMIPGDELEFLDLKGLYSYWVNWQHCTVCKEYCKKNGISGKRELYYDFARRLNEVVKSYGRKMIFANDNIDISKPVDLPRDIVILWWRIAHPGRGPYKGCSMKRFLEAGFEVINIRYEDTYIDLYMTDKKLQSWTPIKRPRVPKGFEDKVLGSLMLAWEGKEHFAWTLPSGIAMMGAKLWDHDTSKNYFTASFRKNLTRAVLGPNTPEGLDIFTPLGGCILPQDEDSSRKGYADLLTEKDASLIEPTLKTLLDWKRRPKAPELLDVYISCIEWTAGEYKKLKQDSDK